MQRHLRNCALRRCVAECICECPPQHCKSFFLCVNRKMFFLPHIVWANVVEAQNVIRVAVRENDSVKAENMFAQRLSAEVRTRINHYVVSSARKQDRGAGALVAWVNGMADTARTCQCRHTHRRAGTQHRELQLIYCGESFLGHG